MTADQSADQYRLQRFRSLCGDFWNLAHETLGWLQDPQLASNTDAQVLAVRLELAIEDYEKLAEQERPTPRRVSLEASAHALDLRQRMP